MSTKGDVESHLISIGGESFWQDSTSIHDKSSKQSRGRRTFLNIVIAIDYKPITSIILNGKKKTFFFPQDNDIQSSLLFSVRIPGYSNQARKSNWNKYKNTNLKKNLNYHYLQMAR